jgi:hypothetical protein
MVRFISRVVVAAFSVIITLSNVNVSAADVNNKGLYVSPARQEISAETGKVTKKTLTLANYTAKPITVNLSVKSFDATDFSYDYKFTDPKDNWLKLGQNQVQLDGGKTVTIPFTVSPPESVSPGGHYLAIFASADMSDTGIRQRAQVVSLQYIKVAGKLIQTGVIENGKAPFLVMGSEISYQFDAKNTGNVHYSPIFFGQLESIFGKQPEAGIGHILMPGTTRTIGGSVPAPLFPGLYTLTYGYKTEFSPQPTIKTTQILYIPPWSIIALVAIVFVAVWIYMKRHILLSKKSKNKES